MLRVLFVCTGNICRSAAAEGVLRKLATEAGLDDRVEIDSAGTGHWHVGEPPDRRMRDAAADRGYDITAQRARAIEPADAGRFDYLIAMDNGHMRFLEAMRDGSDDARPQLFMDFAPDSDHREIPDPYYGGPQDYEFALDLIEVASSGLMDEIKSKLG